MDNHAKKEQPFLTVLIIFIYFVFIICAVKDTVQSDINIRVVLNS